MSNMKKYGVTVTRFGYVEVEAASAEEAVAIVNRDVKTDDVSWSDDWLGSDAEEVLDD